MNATETYVKRRSEIDTKISKIKDLLKDLDMRQAMDSKNWGHAGTAGHINNELKGILESLGNNQ